MGYYQKQNEFIEVVSSTTFSDFSLNINVPSKFNFFVLLENGERLDIQTQLIRENKYYFDDGKYILCECIAKYLIKGKEYYGIAEFGYNQDDSRWRSKKC
jgi:hypothetical protein